MAVVRSWQLTIDWSDLSIDIHFIIILQPSYLSCEMKVLHGSSSLCLVHAGSHLY
jgi:hypothetical protein